jgi:hypothetical protein
MVISQTLATLTKIEFSGSAIRSCAGRGSRGSASGPTEERLVEQLASLLWRLRRVPVFEAAVLDLEAHIYEEDLIDQRLSNNLAADPLSASGATSKTPGDQMRERFLIGRVIGNLMRNDVINKLGRHEAHLIRQVEKTIAQLRALRAERAETDVEDDPKRAAAGYVGRFEGEAAATDVVTDDSFVAEADVNAQLTSQIEQTRAEMLWAERPHLELRGEPGEQHQPLAVAEEPTEIEAEGPEKQDSHDQSPAKRASLPIVSGTLPKQAYLQQSGYGHEPRGTPSYHSARLMRRASHE